MFYPVIALSMSLALLTYNIIDSPCVSYTSHVLCIVMDSISIMNKPDFVGSKVYVGIKHLLLDKAGTENEGK